MTRRAVAALSVLAVCPACSVEPKSYHRERINGFKCIVSSDGSKTTVQRPGMPSRITALPERAP